MWGLKRSEETKEKIRAAAYKREEENTHYKAIITKVTDTKTNITTEYKSLGKAAIALNANKGTLMRYLKNGMLFRDQYKITN